MKFSIFKIFNNQEQVVKKTITQKPFQLKKIPLEQLPGIGRHTPKALARYGIITVNQFAKFDEQEIVALLGKSGLKLLGTAKTLCAA